MKRTDIRWNLVFEFNRMNLVQDERTEQEAEQDGKISLVWTAALLAILFWPFRDEGALRGWPWWICARWPCGRCWTGAPCTAEAFC